jgi:hypothetical protein
MRRTRVLSGGDGLAIWFFVATVVNAHRQKDWLVGFVPLGLGRQVGKARACKAFIGGSIPPRDSNCSSFE